MTYPEVHPLSSCFPRLQGDEFDQLVADIQINGQMEDIILFEGKVLDGQNRLAACIEANVEPRFREFDQDDPAAFVLSVNLHRRHMEPGQRAAAVAAVTNYSQAHQVGRAKKCNLAPLHETYSTNEERAKASGTSVRTQKMADKVAKADPELARQVARGEMSLPEAVEKVSGKRPGKKSQPDQAQDEAFSGTNLVEELEHAQVEIDRLTRLVTTLSADDLGAEVAKWKRIAEDAQAKQGEAMDKAAASEKRESWTKRQLMRCGKAVGEDDPTKIAAAVESFVRARRAK